MFALIDIESAGRLRLTAQEWDVLHTLMAVTNPETNEARITVAEIADRLGIHQPAASRTLSGLRTRSVVFTIRDGVHRVNTWIAYRGAAADWDLATDTEVEPIWERP